MAGTFGYELDPDKLTKEEKEEMKEQIKQYKQYAGLIQNGNYYRLSNPFEDACVAWLFVSADGEEALYNAVMQQIHGNMTVSYIKLKGLLPDAVYEDIQSGRCYSGSALMEAGIPMPVQMKEYPAYQIMFRKKK
jgi:alpha-galactosidase